MSAGKRGSTTIVGVAARGLAALFCAVLLLTPVRSTAARQVDLVPVWDPRPCPAPLPPGEVEGATVRCGVVRVPGEPPATLAVTILNASDLSVSEAEPSDALLFLGGDPGLSVLTPDALADLARRLAPFRTTHDVILFDPRGAGASAPAFHCDPDAPEACLAALSAAGLSLSDFTPAAFAADARAVMRALDYPAYDLYGVSYGARVALAVLEGPEPPATVRSAVLDSTLPPPGSAYAPLTAGHHLARYELFRAVFRLCDEDPDCGGAYPHLRNRFVSLAAHLKQAPRTLPGGAVVTFEDLYHALYPYNDTLSAVPYQPALIYSLSLRRPEGWAYAATLQDERPPYLATPSPDATPLGWFLTCVEGVPFAPDRATFARELGTAPLPDFLEAEIVTGFDRALAACEPLGAAAEAAPPSHQPAAVPALVLHGPLDAVSPPPVAEEVAARLPGARVVLVPGAGHGILGGYGDCPADLVAAFLGEPDRAPETRCLAELAPAFVLPEWWP